MLTGRSACRIFGQGLQQFVLKNDPVYPGEVCKVHEELKHDDLAAAPSPNTMMTASGTLAPRIRQFGREFLDFLGVTD